MMSSGVLRKVALIAGAASILATGALTACSSSKESDKPAESTQAPTSAPSVAPTEKQNVGSFAPTVTARPAPTALPGNVVTGG
jgi:hypothetical protein